MSEPEDGAREMVKLSFTITVEEWATIAAVLAASRLMSLGVAQRRGEPMPEDVAYITQVSERFEKMIHDKMGYEE